MYNHNETTTLLQRRNADLYLTDDVGVIEKEALATNEQERLQRKYPSW